MYLICGCREVIQDNLDTGNSASALSYVRIIPITINETPLHAWLSGRVQPEPLVQPLGLDAEVL